MLEGGSGLCSQGGSLPQSGLGQTPSLPSRSEIVFPTASQTCSLWDAAKEKELEKCKEDIQEADADKVFCASSRIAKGLLPPQPFVQGICPYSMTCVGLLTGALSTETVPNISWPSPPGTYNVLR
ncbi:Hypothetical predicted protein [Marmota monax]|uniref:Uncharacterized protein n=1 Tax=Marmota monax TaxID=9995 RepID=A0A5E4AVY4_MARMO|nr:hypothetical protein GHT09_013042 [Marmota monax]VTJ60689.1 Hypothetical predicted protein [Marmota monax]